MHIPGCSTAETPWSWDKNCHRTRSPAFLLLLWLMCVQSMGCKQPLAPVRIPGLKNNSRNSQTSSFQAVKKQNNGPSWKGHLHPAQTCSARVPPAQAPPRKHPTVCLTTDRDEIQPSSSTSLPLPPVLEQKNPFLPLCNPQLPAWRQEKWAQLLPLHRGRDAPAEKLALVCSQQHQSTGPPEAQLSGSRKKHWVSWRKGGRRRQWWL